MITATRELEIDEMQRRALMRLAREEASNQENMEAILDKAVNLVGDDASPENIDSDWIRRFFDRSRLISDEAVQDVWAKLLAGEADSPGTYSKRAIDVLDSLDSKDIHTFSRLCSFAVIIGTPTVLIYDVSDSIYQGNGLSMYDISTLESVGLVHQSIGYERSGLEQSGHISYFEKKLYIEFTESQLDPGSPDSYRMSLGTVVISKAGRELLRLVEPHGVEGFPEYLRSKWRALGYRTEPSSE